ncbi:hypothetical protein ASF27_01120 [Methylobacterium sp. Leaf102]|uniref:hypothetical protein n=1 Tax=unclassified Methylobacterium TaxID=2615210 RepID=UPI0006F52846|nr:MULTISPECIES: hypothetical protein [unclassified Methylobacterium]KQP34200.1 hypothetical protein ASF27_01120 [Methylobacterium sp. Leaf102]KQP62095.1 hypothetical protein ASF52_05375 [Methylobacterium sp. Leaf112]
MRAEIVTVQDTASDLLLVSGAHQMATGRIAAGVGQVPAPRGAATQHRDSVRTTTDAALAQPHALWGTWGQLWDQERALGEAMRALGGTTG